MYYNIGKLMRRLGRMRRFDYSFLRDGMLPARLINTISAIYSLRTMSDIRKDEHIGMFSELEKIAKVQSVKGSNAIEGIVSSDKRIEAIVNQNTAPISHDEQEIAGYRDALNKIHLNYEHLDFSEKDILDLHSILLSHTGMDYAGEYKTHDNAIIEIDSMKNRRIRFSPVSAEDTPKAMEQLCLAYYSARSDSSINQLLLIPCVILDFLCTHPFRDGNGRMSRLLSLLLLYKENFDIIKYVSFEEQINMYKVYYYDSLQKSSTGWHSSENDYFPFIENFLSTLYMCYKELDKRFAVIKDHKFNKQNRVEAAVLGSLTPISKQELHDILPDISIPTIESVLSRMLKEGRIAKIGSTRSARYVRNE